MRRILEIYIAICISYFPYSPFLYFRLFPIFAVSLYSPFPYIRLFRIHYHRVSFPYSFRNHYNRFLLFFARFPEFAFFRNHHLRIVINKENALRRLSINKMGAICPRIPGRKKGTAHALYRLLQRLGVEWPPLRYHFK